MCCTYFRFIFKGKIIVEESYLYLTNCTIQTLSSDDYLLSLQNKSRCECFHCIFNHSGNFAISIDNFSSLDFKKSLVRKSNYACISITGGSTFRGQQSEISDSKGDGLIFDTQSQGTLVDCLINNCTLRGISSNTGSFCKSNTLTGAFVFFILKQGKITLITSM